MGISRASLAAAVANEGGIGVIASAGLGFIKRRSPGEPIETNTEILRQEIRKARQMTQGLLGVNIMVALTDYHELIRTAVEEKIDLIISGAGLPMDLPGLVEGSATKIMPIVSSARALALIWRRWKKHYNRVPDGVIVEGPEAGGHLGYAHQEVLTNTAPTLEHIVAEVLEVVRDLDPAVPVIAAGGIYDGQDIARFLALGAAGVQMATRFVCTEECDAHINFKQAYIDAKIDDVAIIHSPVGMPGRVIRNDFVDQMAQGKRRPLGCRYQCLRSCDPRTAPYCIAQVLANAARGEMDDAFAFAGSNVHRCHEIIPVKQLMRQLIEETQAALDKTNTRSTMR